MSPIKDVQNDMKLAMVELAKNISQLPKEFVSIREVDARGGRTQAELLRLNADLTANEMNNRRSMEQADANLQRQIDDMKKAFGDTFSLRDALLQMRRELDDLRNRPSS